MILCFQFEDLLETFLVSKLEMNRPNIKLIITFCAICHYRDLRTFAPKSSHTQIFSKLSLQVENDKIRLKT